MNVLQYFRDISPKVTGTLRTLGATSTLVAGLCLPPDAEAKESNSDKNTHSGLAIAGGVAVLVATVLGTERYIKNKLREENEKYERDIQANVNRVCLAYDAWFYHGG